ncbi:MAG: hypothetical protein EOP88_10560 [Verrucomicrobiaceae bacterium]|nr:MAG: hypothetical protein EOP88_10560 [Verrucomicrobiaceae bacterium]
MTHRRLFHYFLIGNTLVLAVAWTVSLGYESSVSGMIPTHALSFYLEPGTINVQLMSASFGGYGVDASHLPRASSGPVLTTGNLRFTVEQEAWRFSSGRFGMGNIPLGNPPQDKALFVYFPVWLPFVVLAGGGYSAMRWRERRMDADEERLE